MESVHVVLIAGHATSAVLAFVFGVIAFVRIPDSSADAPFVIHRIALWVAVVGLVTVVIVDWVHLDLARRIAFPLLGVLALYMVWRTERARGVLRAQPPGWRRAFLGHIGFVLISLFDGFCIVLAIDLRLPVWVVIGAAVLGVVVGVIAIRARVRQEGDAEATGLTA